LKYDRFNSDKFSFEAWCELLEDLVDNNQKLKTKLIIELVQYKKDLVCADHFLQVKI
jgi:hypothetical protein